MKACGGDLGTAWTPSGNHWRGVWVGPSAGLHDRKFFILPELELRPLGHHPVASRYADWATEAIFCRKIARKSVIALIQR
jgi:hypothetical protein